MARRLLILNGLATLGVILNHAASWGFISMFWWTDQYLPVDVPNFGMLGSWPYYLLRFIEQLITFSVPSFLFVSGFFIAFAAGRLEASAGWKVAWARIKTLAVPYILWSVAIFIGYFYILLGRTFTPGQYLRMLATGGAADPYYYIPMLIQLFLLAPLLFPLARNHWKLLLIIATLIHVMLQGIRYLLVFGVEAPILERLVSLTPGWLFLGNAIWFVLGIVMNLHLKTFMPQLIRFRRLLVVLVFVFLVFGMIEWEFLLAASSQDWIAYSSTLLDSIYSAAFILAFIAYERSYFPLSKRAFDLGGKSYGVYLVHSLILIVVSRIIYNLVPAVLGYQVLFQTILIVMGLGIPLLLMAAVRKSPARDFYHYLFG